MKASPLDYELAELIDHSGIRALLEALCREVDERRMPRLYRRLCTVSKWLNSPAGERDMGGPDMVLD